VRAARVKRCGEILHAGVDGGGGERRRCLQRVRGIDDQSVREHLDPGVVAEARPVWSAGIDIRQGVCNMTGQFAADRGAEVAYVLALVQNGVLHRR